MTACSERPALLLLLALAGCAPMPPAPMARAVPLPATQGQGDPGRSAVMASAAALSDTSRLAGRPAEAARQVARLEWLAASLLSDPAWASATALLGPALEQARAEAREVLGIPATAEPASVARALLDAASAQDAGNAAAAAGALDPVSGGSGRAVLSRLAALPPLPAAARATGLAQDQLSRDSRLDYD